MRSCARRGLAPGLQSCVLGQIMSGVVAAMRRTLLSCTSLARYGLIALAIALPASLEPALAADLTITQAISALFDLNHQEFAALTSALSLLGFTVVAAILLMRTRIRATRVELNLRSDIADLQVQADRLRALAVRRAPDPDRLGRGRQPAPDQRRHRVLISQDAMSNSPQRILAFGTWLPPEPALQMDHAVDALREAGEGFLLNLSTSNGRAIEAMGRAIGGQAIVRILRTRGLAPGTRRIQSPLQDAVGGDRAVARLRCRGALADLGQERRRQSAVRQCGLCARHRGRQRRGYDSSQPRTAGE